MRLRFLAPYLCVLNAPEDPPDDPKGGGGDEKKFTQADLNGILKKEADKLTKKLQTEAAEALKAKTDELELKISELTESIETAGKSAEEKERARAIKAEKKLHDDLAASQARVTELEGKLATETGAHRSTRTRYALTTLFTRERVLPDALTDALDVMEKTSEQEYDESGNLVAITLSDGTRHDDPDKAVKAFLEKRQFYVEPQKPGTGQRRPSGNRGGEHGTDVDSMSAGDLLAAGFAEAPRGAQRSLPGDPK